MVVVDNGPPGEGFLTGTLGPWAFGLPRSERSCVCVCVFFFFADTMDSVKDVLGKMGKRFGEAARKTENITGNFWQHCELRFPTRLFHQFQL